MNENPAAFWNLKKKTDESVTLVHTVRIKKQEANLEARPETLTWYKWLDVSFFSVFSYILRAANSFLQ